MSSVEDKKPVDLLKDDEIKSENVSPSEIISVAEVLKEIKTELLKDEVTATPTNASSIQPNEKPADEYGYINQGFTSEIFKIEIKNLPKHYGASNLKKILNDVLKLKPSKIKIVKPGCHYAFACFRNEEDRQEAITKINGHEWKGKKLQAIVSKPSPDPLVKKRNQEKQGGFEPKKQKTLEESTTPLAYLSYEEQLKRKQSEMENLLKGFGNKYWLACGPSKRQFIEEQRKLHDGLPCQVLPIKSSPQIDGYRNKW